MGITIAHSKEFYAGLGTDIARLPKTNWIDCKIPSPLEGRATVFFVKLQEAAVGSSRYDF